MPFENGQQGKDKQKPEHLRPISDEGEGAEKVDITDPAAAPLSADPQDAEQVMQKYYAEASLTKKITVFALTTVLVLIALGLIYAYWPLGRPR